MAANSHRNTYSDPIVLFNNRALDEQVSNATGEEEMGIVLANVSPKAPLYWFRWTGERVRAGSPKGGRGRSRPSEAARAGYRELIDVSRVGMLRMPALVGCPYSVKLLLALSRTASDCCMASARQARELFWTHQTHGVQHFSVLVSSMSAD